jgi:hypothetical protein
MGGASPVGAQSAPRRSSFDRPQTWELIALAVVIAALNAPLLARSPQNPDGAEMILAAGPGGGVLHPPGFPLQSWLDRLFIQLPIGNLAFRLSLLSWLAHSAAVVVLGRVLLELGCGRTALWFGIGAFAFSQPTWSLAVQPEKYAVTSLLLALCILQALRFCRRADSSFSTRDAVACGLLSGLALGQHTITVFYIPAFLVSLYCLQRSPRGRFAFPAIAAVTSAFVVAALYLSLLLQAHGAVWPDWGKISGIRDVLNHVLRSDFHIIQASKKEAAIRGLDVLAEQSYATWRLACVLPAVGVIGLWRWGRKRELVAVAGCLLGALVFLLLVQFGTASWVGLTYLERYTVAAVVAGAALAGVGVEVLVSIAARWRWTTWAVRLSAAASIAAVVYLGWEAADARRDDTLDVFRAGLRISIDDRDIWVAATDFEIFYGMPSRRGTRFPIIAGYSWSARALPVLEPRLAGVSGSRTDLVRTAYKRGFRVVGVTRTSLDGSPGAIRQRGTVWVTERSPGPYAAYEPVRRASLLCDAIRTLRPLPAAGHFYSRFLWQWFPFAFEGAQSALREMGDEQGAELSGRVAEALQEGHDARSWREPCDGLRAHLAGRQP